MLGCRQPQLGAQWGSAHHGTCASHNWALPTAPSRTHSSRLNAYRLVACPALSLGNQNELSPTDPNTAQAPSPSPSRQELFSSMSGDLPSSLPSTPEALQQLLGEIRSKEEAFRAQRETIELQLMRLEQQDKLRQSASISTPEPASGPPGGRRKVMKPKSKRMAAMAAGAGLLRVPQSGSTSISTQPRPGVSSSPGSRSPPVPDQPPERITDHVGTASDTQFSGDILMSLDPSPETPTPGAMTQLLQQAFLDGAQGREGLGQPDAMCVVPKPIFIISDCTGESAARTVRAALKQFELCFKTSAPASLFVFRFVEDEKKAYKIIEAAAKDDALVVYTLVDPATIKAVQTACTLYSVRHVDLWSNLLDCMESYLDATRSGVPMSQLPRRPVLGEDYFRMIEAVEYTRKMDDGANPKDWKRADLLILGVSRCGKTPLSVYLGQRGYRVANLPLVSGVPIPKELYEIDQTRIVGLTIDPHVLLSIRRNRIGMMGMKDFAVPIDYAEIQKINTELMWARQLYAANPDWPVLDVTLRGVEETAARILKILNDKRGDASPQWVEEMYGKMAARAASPSAAEKPVTARASPGVEQMYIGGEQYLVEGLY